MADEATKQRLLLLARARLRLKQKQGTAPAKIGTGEDVARSLATGVGEGVTGTVGMLGDVQSLADDLGSWVGDQFGLKPLTPEQSAGFTAARAPTTAGIEKTIGFDQIKHEPQTVAGKFARTAGQFTPGFAAGGFVRGGVGTANRMLGTAGGGATGVAAGVGSEAAGQLAEGTALETPARIAGGLIAGIGTPIAARRAITPRNIPPNRAHSAQVLRDEGIDNLTEGQISGSAGVKARERKAGSFFSDQTARRDQQLERLTQASLARAGILAPRATPQVMDDAFTNIGRQFDGLAARNTVTVDPQFGQDIATGIQRFMELGPATERVTALRGFVDRIGRVIDQQGNISGRAYQSIRSDIERAARNSQAGSPEYAHALRELRESFDEAMERSMTAAGSQDLGAWRDARNRYRNLLVVEDALASTGEDAAAGLIGPKALRNAVKRKQGTRNMVTGQGPFEELSRSAVELMGDLPLTGFAPAASDSIWKSVWFPFEAATRIARDIRMTRPVQRYLTNSALRPPNAPLAQRVSPATPAVVPPFSDFMRERNKPAP
jgi:hypothetical protein